jgi:hypothetical protein
MAPLLAVEVGRSWRGCDRDRAPAPPPRYRARSEIAQNFNEGGLKMSREIGPLKGLVALTTLALLCGTTWLSPRAAIALDIINSENGTKLGSIAFPAESGSSPEGVAFEFDSGLGQFTQDDITSVSWALDPQTGGVQSLDLSAFMGDSPCTIAEAPCSNVALTLTPSNFFAQEASCEPNPDPLEPSICFSSGFFGVIEIIDAAPAYACVGFEPPLADGPVTVRGNRALPLKAELLDEDDVPLTDADLSAAPVVQVEYHSGIGGTPEDVSDQALWAGQGSDGNAFEFSGDRWRFNLKVGNFDAPGTYVITMISGDEAEYRVEPTCEAEFVVEP